MVSRLVSPRRWTSPASVMFALESPRFRSRGRRPRRMRLASVRPVRPRLILRESGSDSTRWEEGRASVTFALSISRDSRPASPRRWARPASVRPVSVRSSWSEAGGGGSRPGSGTQLVELRDSGDPDHASEGLAPSRPASVPAPSMRAESGDQKLPQRGEPTQGRRPSPVDARQSSRRVICLQAVSGLPGAPARSPVTAYLSRSEPSPGTGAAGTLARVLSVML